MMKMLVVPSEPLHQASEAMGSVNTLSDTYLSKVAMTRAVRDAEQLKSSTPKWWLPSGGWLAWALSKCSGGGGGGEEKKRNRSYIPCDHRCRSIDDHDGW